MNELYGSSECPVCSRDYPHEHNTHELSEYIRRRELREAFESFGDLWWRTSLEKFPGSWGRRICLFERNTGGLEALRGEYAWFPVNALWAAFQLGKECIINTKSVNVKDSKPLDTLDECRKFLNKASAHHEFLPCPFCGMDVDLDNGDTLYPTGMYWREEDGIRHYIRHKDRKEGDFMVWGMHCPETAGGCGMEITADNKQDVINAWNRRTYKI